MKPGLPAFEGRAALVTGAGRGIGRAIALGLATAGARVALLARSQDELDHVAKEVRAAGGAALAIRADMGDPGAVEGAAARTLSEFGVIDILINNAGVVWPLEPSATVAIADWTAALSVNVVGAVHLTFALLPTMLKLGWGRVVNISSGVAEHPAAMIGANAYTTSKAALEAHSLNLAAELLGTGVTVNAYRPGGVDTAMQGWIRDQPPERIGAALHRRFVGSYTEGALITPEESARSLIKRLPTEASGEIWNVGDV